MTVGISPLSRYGKKAVGRTPRHPCPRSTGVSILEPQPMHVHCSWSITTVVGRTACGSSAGSQHSCVRTVPPWSCCQRRCRMRHSLQKGFNCPVNLQVGMHTRVCGGFQITTAKRCNQASCIVISLACRMHKSVSMS